MTLHFFFLVYNYVKKKEGVIIKKSKEFLVLFFTMFKIGLFTFGGGYAMIALLESEFIERKKWIEKEEFMNMAAIAESTPGPIAINAATYIGYKLGGFAGSLVSTLGICIPSFTVIFLISIFFDEFISLTWVNYAFKGIQVCVIYLILSAGVKMLRSLEKNAFNIILFSAVVVTAVLFSLFAIDFSAIFYILICGFVGVFAFAFRRFSGKEDKK